MDGVEGGKVQEKRRVRSARGGGAQSAHAGTQAAKAGPSSIIAKLTSAAPSADARKDLSVAALSGGGSNSGDTAAGDPLRSGARSAALRRRRRRARLQQRRRLLPRPRRQGCTLLDHPLGYQCAMEGEGILAAARKRRLRGRDVW